MASSFSNKNITSIKDLKKREYKDPKCKWDPKIEEEIRKYITADSLAYLSLDGMLNASPGRPDQYCNACFTERYPIPLTRAEEWQLGLFDPSI